MRFKLPVSGATYNFGAKFGATVELAIELLRKVADAGFIPSLTFHPGTQCTDPQAWEHYIRAAGDIARGAGVTHRAAERGRRLPARTASRRKPRRSRRSSR